MSIDRVINLNPGSVVRWQDEDWVIAELDEFKRVLAKRLIDGRREFLPIAEIAPPRYEVGARAHDEATLQRRLKQSAMRAGHPDYKEPSEKELVRDALRNELSRIAQLPRGKRVNALEAFAREQGISRATAYRRLNLILAGVGSDGFRLQRSDKGVIGSRKTPRTIEIIEEQLARFHFIPTPRTLADCLELINGALKAEGLPKVGMWIVTSVRNKRTHREVLLARGRKKEARDRFRTSAGHLPNNDYPLAIIQIDHTPVQLCLVDSESRREIGKANLTLVLDTYSRMVLGFYLSFDPPSAHSAGIALARAFLPKDDYLKKLGIDADWPCWGFPDVVLADNAQDLNGHVMQLARQQFRFTIRNRPVGFPQFGGAIESAFKTFMHEIKSIPGTTFENPQARGEYDSGGNAIFDIESFEKYFTIFITKYYHLRKHDGNGMNGRAPLQRWKAGIFSGDVFPPMGLPDLPANPRAIEISLMPVEWRVITKGTVQMFELNYYSHEIEDLGRRQDLKKDARERKYEVRYDKRNIAQIWVRDPDSGEFYAAQCTSAIGPISYWEHKARKQALGRPAEEFASVRYEAIRELENMKDEQARLTKKEARNREKIRRNRASALPIKSTPVPTTSSINAPTSDELAALREEILRNADDGMEEQ